VKTIGKRILELRTAKGLTQEELAGLTGLDLSTIGNIESQRLPGEPSLHSLRQIAAAMEVSLEFIIADTKPHKTASDRGRGRPRKAKA